ncbi:MAG: hypothetical protein ACTH2U_12575 [Brevibacterium sp.]
MAEYAKPCLSVDEHIDRLAKHGVEIEDRSRAVSVPQALTVESMGAPLDWASLDLWRS